jgi:hypothetical protein
MKISTHFCILFACLAATTILSADPITAFRTGDELVVKLDRLDLLRQAHPQLNTELKLHRKGGDKTLLIDLSDPAVQGALIIDLAQFGQCDSLTATMKDRAGQVVTKQTIAPIPEVRVQSRFASPPTGKPASAQAFAFIEPGAEMRKAQTPAPRIVLPDANQLREIRLAQPGRMVAKKDITFPVLADVDFPIVSNAVTAGQTAAPNDPSRASLYFTCKKAIYDGPRVDRWQKFLVEVPVQNAWGAGNGDESVVLRADQFLVHVTNEKSPSGRNMLNNSDGDLGQKGEIDTDEQGRIYWRIDGGGGAYVARFNPHTKKFEQPPVRIDFQKLVPAGAGMLNDGLCKVSCTRGRVFFTMCNDTLTNRDPGNAHRRRLGGVFSIPQDWSDAAAFAADIRLHAGTWESARPAFYQTPPKPDADVRKLGGCSVTDTGLFITTAGTKYEGGTWRLDLDAQGNTRFFGEVKSLGDTVAKDGTPLPPTKLVMAKGLPKGRELNPGPGAGLNLIDFKSGEITIPRASVRLLTQGFDGLTVSKASKHAFPIYDGAPSGIVTVRYDLIAGIKSNAEARGPLADSLSGGSSMGPAFLLSPIPGEANRIMAVCEYAGYPLSVLDFSHLAGKHSVGKSFLPPSVPARTGLGPYNSLWVRHDDEQWLYVSGYTGMSRIQYSKAGKPLPTVEVDVFNGRLIQKSPDGQGRSSMKKVDGLIHVFGGRVMDSGYGLDGRGADAFSTGVELFDPHQLVTREDNRVGSQTAAYMSRCFALKTLQGRVVWNASDGSRRQEIFAASGSVRKQIINELRDPSVGPSNLDAKIFLYEITGDGVLRERFGFSLPGLGNDRAVEGHIALSPCHRFLVIMTQDAMLYTYDIAQRQFVDAAVLRAPSGGDIRPIEFKRPSEIIFTSPDGQIFFLTEPFDKDATSINFHRVIVGHDGTLAIEPHLGISFGANEGCQDFRGIVRCFLPDLTRRDGSYDFILGYGQQNVEPFVRVVTDFIPPATRASR